MRLFLIPSLMKTLRYILSLFLFIVLSPSGQAAHLVGGEITYTCLGGSQYQIDLRVYRDCASGGAAFDNAIEIRVFNGVTGALVQALPGITFDSIVQVPLNSGDPCLTIPPGLCTEYTTYRTTVNLPSSPDGYVVTWQRCCRNGSISNIPTPGSWGNTYTVTIPANDACGNAPTYVNTPPIVICAGEPLQIDASASDVDGDSLYYEFCEILHGGGTGNPTPTAGPPPYQTIPFLAPLTYDNPITSSPQIRIDSITGMITGVATTQGQYVVGICVSSYKNGALETLIRRDFQFNVSTCVRNVISDMVTQTEDPALYCAGRTIPFTEEASNGQTFFWDFGDPNVLTDTSSLPNPTYTYAATGTYNVTLIVNPGTNCADTVVEVFEIYEDPELEWGIWDGSICFNRQGIVFAPVSNHMPPNATFTWYLGGTPAPNIPFFQGAFTPPISWPLPGKYPVTLVMNSPTCTDSIVDTVEIVRFNQIVDAGPDQTIFEGDSVVMNASGGVTYLWYADKPVYFSDPRDPQAATVPIHDTTWYYVEVTTANGCQGIDSMQVFVLPRNWPDPDYSNLQNVITPNGDGLNDYLDLRILVNGRTDVRFALHNRWGDIVYEETAYIDQWNGQDNGGNPLPDGTYYYVLQEGTEVFFTAPVTIIRNE